MRVSVRNTAAAAGAVLAILSGSFATASTISKNIPGAIRHPINEAAKAVGADHPTPHRRYSRTRTVRYHRYRRYSRFYSVRTRRAAHRIAHRRAHRRRK